MNSSCNAMGNSILVNHFTIFVVPVGMGSYSISAIDSIYIYVSGKSICMPFREDPARICSGGNQSTGGQAFQRKAASGEKKR